MNGDELARKVVDTMYSQDWFSQWLGIERVEIRTGKCILRMQVRNEMLNGFGIAHGGITYSLADSALAFASNSYGIRSVSVETAISHTESVKEGDIITATATEQHRSNKIGIYSVSIINQYQKTVAIFKGVVYRTSKEWFPTENS